MPPKPITPNTVKGTDMTPALADESSSVLSAYAKVPSRWPLVTKTVRIGTGVAGVGVQVTQQALGTTTVVALFTAGAAASATGIGLIVGGAVVTVGSIVASARSAYKTYGHLKVLKALLGRGKEMPCSSISPSGHAGPCDSAQHLEVMEALDYMIHKKEKKLGKKVVGATGLGVTNTVYGIGKAIYKLARGTKGVNRTSQANVIARHLITHNCALAQGIVADLYSTEEMLWMLDQDSHKVTELVAEKMKST